MTPLTVGIPGRRAPGTRFSGFGTRFSGFGTRDSGYLTRVSGPGTKLGTKGIAKLLTVRVARTAMANIVSSGKRITTYWCNQHIANPFYIFFFGNLQLLD